MYVWSFGYSARNAHAPIDVVCGLPRSTIFFPHYFISY